MSHVCVYDTSFSLDFLSTGWADFVQICASRSVLGPIKGGDTGIWIWFSGSRSGWIGSRSNLDYLDRIQIHIQYLQVSPSLGPIGQYWILLKLVNYIRGYVQKTVFTKSGSFIIEWFLQPNRSNSISLERYLQDLSNEQSIMKIWQPCQNLRALKCILYGIFGPGVEFHYKISLNRSI